MKFFSSILFLILSISIFFVFIDPFYLQVKTLRSDVDTYNKALNNSTELQKTRDSLLGIYNSIKKEDKDRLSHLLPNNIDNIELILEIEKIANSHGLPVGNIRFDTKSLEDKNASSGNLLINPSGGSSSYGVFPMDFTIEGRYDTFISFLKDLEKNLRLVDVKSISFTSNAPISSIPGGINDSNVYNYTLKVQTYWLK
jgi:Tfp pilus assembly protein PilO